MLKLLVLKLVFRKFVKMMTTMTILKDMILIPYTAERRDVLGNTSPEAREISQGQGFCT